MIKAFFILLSSDKKKTFIVVNRSGQNLKRWKSFCRTVEVECALSLSRSLQWKMDVLNLK